MRQRAMQVIESLEIDPRKPLAVVIEPHDEERSLSQNRRYWATIAEAAREIGYSREELHQILLGRHFGTEVIEACGVKIVQPIRTTTTDEGGRRSVLTRRTWRDYEEWAFAFIASEFAITV